MEDGSMDNNVFIIHWSPKPICENGISFNTGHKIVFHAIFVVKSTVSLKSGDMSLILSFKEQLMTLTFVLPSKCSLNVLKQPLTSTRSDSDSLYDIKRVANWLALLLNVLDDESIIHGT